MSVRALLVFELYCVIKKKTYSDEAGVMEAQ